MPIYMPERLNVLPVFNSEQQRKLMRAVAMYPLHAFLSNGRNVEEVGIDFVYTSSKLEGNMYTKLDTLNLLKLGITAGGKLYSDAHMIMNLRDAYLYTLSSKGVSIDRSFVCDIHALLSKNMLPSEHVGTPRSGSVRIAGTDYHPPVGANYLVEEMNYLLDIASTIDNAFVRAVYLKLNLCYLQFFQDVNKRTARMVQNAVLLEGGVVPLLNGYTKSSGYIEAIVDYYDTGKYTKYLTWFVSSYVEMTKGLSSSPLIGPPRKKDLRG